MKVNTSTQALKNSIPVKNCKDHLRLIHLFNKKNNNTINTLGEKVKTFSQYDMTDLENKILNVYPQKIFIYFSLQDDEDTYKW